MSQILDTVETDLLIEIRLAIFEDSSAAPARAFNLQPVEEGALIIETESKTIDARLVLPISDVFKTAELIRSGDLHEASIESNEADEDVSQCELCGATCAEGVYTEYSNSPWSIVHEDCLIQFISCGKELFMNSSKETKANYVSRSV